MLFINCVYELHWPLHFGSQKYAKVNETASAAVLLVRVSPDGMLYRSKDNVIVGQVRTMALAM